MSFLFSLLVVLHLICWAVALGTWVAAARTRVPNPGMAHATAGAVVIGVILAALVSIPGLTDGDPNHMKLGIKLLVGLVAVVLAYIARKKGPETPSAVWFGIPTAIILNVIVAVFV
jgi:peptidoglycan/LPS O-acetylase OafA/YrhL